MHGGQSSRAWALLGLRGAGAVRALGAGENAARGEDQDMAVGEFLLELAGETVIIAVSLGPCKIEMLRSCIEDKDLWEWERKYDCLPLLYSVEALKGWDGDKYDNSLLAVANFNLQLIKVSMRAPWKTWSATRPIDFSAPTPRIYHITFAAYHIA
jgi:hypothetical protein